MSVSLSLYMTWYIRSHVEDLTHGPLQVDELFITSLWA